MTKLTFPEEAGAVDWSAAVAALDRDGYAIVPGLLPSLIGISLFRLDENVRSSLVLGFVGAGGIGFHLLTAMNLFQYRQVATLLILMYALVLVVERLASAIRARIR